MIELMMIELSEKQREGASLPGQPAGPACRASLPGQPAGPESLSVFQVWATCIEQTALFPNSPFCSSLSLHRHAFKGRGGDIGDESEFALV